MTDPDPAKAQWGDARLQTQANRARIIAALRAGMPLSRVWRALTSEGALTVSYRAFCRHANALQTEAQDARQGARRETHAPIDSKREAPPSRNEPYHPATETGRAAKREPASTATPALVPPARRPIIAPDAQGPDAPVFDPGKPIDW